MFAAVTPVLILLTAAAIYVRADPDPNNPGPGDVFIQGQSCTIGWNVDLTGVWTTMNIDLMTGDNFNMIFLTTVATVDGTDPNKNKISVTCPQVTPHSPIYFYQFSSPATSNKTWTGRFTITDSAQNVVAPANSTQPNGVNIPWGIGALVGASSSAAPSTSMTSVTTTISASGSPTPSITPGSTLVPTTSSSTPTPTVVVVPITSTVVPTPSTVSTTGTNGAVTMLSVSNVVLQAGLALGLAALGFVATF